MQGMLNLLLFVNSTLFFAMVPFVVSHVAMSWFVKSFTHNEMFRKLDPVKWSVNLSKYV